MPSTLSSPTCRHRIPPQHIFSVVAIPVFWTFVKARLIHTIDPHACNVYTTTNKDEQSCLASGARLFQKLPHNLPQQLLLQLRRQLGKLQQQ